MAKFIIGNDTTTVTVAGIPAKPLTYFAGYTGGGLWRTDDAGINWKNISDGQFKTSSIGAIAVAPSDANVLYVGTGEHAVRASHPPTVTASTRAPTRAAPG